MKKYLAVFLGSEDSPAAKRWEALDESARGEREKAGMGAWQAWVMKNQHAILDHGAPLGPTQRVDARGIASTRNNLTAYTLVQAESHEAASKLFLGHPHFTIFPGDTIEIIECLPIPGMPD